MPVTPRPEMEPTPATMRELEKLAAQGADTERRLKATVLKAAREGGSMRVIAKAANLSKTTVQKYIAEARTQG